MTLCYATSRYIRKCVSVSTTASSFWSGVPYLISSGFSLRLQNATSLLMPSSIWERIPEMPPPDASVSSIPCRLGFHCLSIGEEEKQFFMSLKVAKALSLNSNFFFVSSFLNRFVIGEVRLAYCGINRR